MQSNGGTWIHSIIVKSKSRRIQLTSLRQLSLQSNYQPKQPLLFRCQARTLREFAQAWQLALNKLGKQRCGPLAPQTRTSGMSFTAPDLV